MCNSTNSSIANDGFAIIENVIPKNVAQALLSALANELGSYRAGTRQLHQKVPAIADFLE